MKTVTYSTLLLLSSMAVLAVANPAAAAPTCVLGIECVDGLPATQCIVYLTGSVETGVGCNNGTLDTLCVIKGVGCVSVNRAGCLFYAGLTPGTMKGYYC